ncbi:hypothetical protein GcC1_006001 [Golovinomyces cichoracearum]|uniref:Uncharacterized protein n=1 Tax=Golovinomyces cichoracearum TaxID=62708 RepID=A0A420J8N6_9PEZI|nr:hypothetical protein GcC1_006001 [Golovinomyces cichoracearum]
MSKFVPTQVVQNKSTAKSQGQFDHRLTSYFSRSQLALAVTIQKFKPKNLRTFEYCEQLRKHIKIGKSTPKGRLRYIDTVEFWKDQYTKIHIQKKELEDKVHSLEQQISIPRYEVQNINSELVELENDAQKFISNDSSRIDLSSRSSRWTTNKPTEANLTVRSNEEDEITDEDLRDLCSYVLRIRRQRFLLEKALDDTNTLDRVENLAKVTRKVLNVIENVLCKSCQPHSLLKSCKPQILKIFSNISIQIVMAFLTCFSALNELCGTIPGRAHKYEITYYMVMFFRTSLDILHTSSRMQANHEKSHDHDPCDKGSDMEKTEYIVNKSVAHCLSSILRNIDWETNNSGHGSFLEGILFLILEHTGHLISEAVFLEHVAASDNPGNATKSTTIKDDKFTRFESRYIVQVLHAAFGDQNRKRVLAQVLSANNPSMFAPSAMLSNDFLSRASFLLQSTLVKSAVGSDDLVSLRLPTPPTEEFDFNLDEGRNNYGSEWLLEQVWAIIGWDLVT